MVRSEGVAKVLLAFDDVGMAVQLQEELEGIGHDVHWDGARHIGPAEGPTWADVVLITADGGPRELAATVRAWHDADPPPALLIIGPGAAEREAAATVRVPFVELDLVDARDRRRHRPGDQAALRQQPAGVVAAQGGAARPRPADRR